VTTNERPAIINERYELGRRIGRGGMADVFLARDRLLDRQVAIKVLFPEFAVDPNFVERFRREAQAAANLNHPNIVNVFDWGKHSGTYFIAMEYVEGRTLADILRSNGHLTSKQAAEIASEVAAALGFAHAAGLVHRDIKPANILIGTRGSVKVADFGIARALNSSTESQLTQAGAVMGTATYFSPEQAQGAQPDPRSDLYSLGIVMYEMAAGRPPFGGDNPVSIAYKQVHDYPTPLNQVVLDIPRPYEAIIAKLLTKDPAVRYSSADALREDLRRFRNGERPVALESAAATARATGAVTTAVVNPSQQRTAVQRKAGGGPGRPTGPGGPRPGTGGRPAVVVPARYRDDRSSRTGWYALAAFFALVSLGIGGFLLFNALSDNDDPGNARALDDYVGQELSVVTDSLNRLQRPYSLQEEDQANDFGPNIVTRTEPKAGVILGDDTVVAVFYNPDATTAVVPDVSGRTLDEARSALRTAGFQVVSATTAPDATVAAGRVIRTDPPAGQDVNVQAEVKIVVSSGTAAASTEGSLTVPYLIQKTEERARSILADAGLDVVVVYYDGPDARDNDGLVMNVEPRYNAPVSAGDTITITVGRPSVAPPTNPPQTNSPQTNPPQTNPPATNPPATNPPPTNPPPTNPPTTPPPTTAPTPTTAAAPTTTAAPAG
jgi:eukaryotic-like serine/threonine-protein kinase